MLELEKSLFILVAKYRTHPRRRLKTFFQTLQKASLA